MARKKTDTLSWVVIGGGLAALALYLLSKNQAAAATVALPGAGGASSSPSSSASLLNFEPPSSSAVTTAQLVAAGNLAPQLTAVAPIPSGYVLFPSGTSAPAANFGGGNTAMDQSGNYYVSWGGQWYQIGQQDAQGNWPATLAQGIA